MPHADIHTGYFRAFVQTIAGYAEGLETRPTPADETGFDLLQGFGEVSVPLETDTTYRIGRVTLGLNADIIGGDKNPDSRTLQTFNPMFPKAKFFGELTPLGPSNIYDLHSSIHASLTRELTLGFSEIGYWR